MIGQKRVDVNSRYDFTELLINQDKKIDKNTNDINKNTNDINKNTNDINKNTNDINKNTNDINNLNVLSNSKPYIFLSQNEYENLIEYEEDKLYWVTYPLSNCFLIWKNGVAVAGIGKNNIAGYELACDNISYKSYATSNYENLAIAYSPVGSSPSIRNVYKNLVNIDIAKNVTTIDYMAFFGCSSLKGVNIGNGVVTINAGSFQRCSALENITIPSSVTNINSMYGASYEQVFFGCDALKTIIINKPTNSIAGSPWGATNATVVWTG